MYDTLILGQISKDINVNHDGVTVRENGGAVLYSGFAAGSLGHKTAVLPKANSSEIDSKKIFETAQNVDVYPLESPNSTSIKNVYHTQDKEQRTSTAISRIDTYRSEEIPPINAKIYHVAGLMRSDFRDDIINFCYGKAKIAFDVQGVLRCAEPDGSMIFRDWDDKKNYLPKIDFLKTDARESKVLTGTEDRIAAAKMLYEWSQGGNKEIMITHYTEVLIYDGKKIYTQPLKPRNLSGRSGRGDTCFSAYITERLDLSIEDALLIAAATVSLKMENLGPFNLGRNRVEEYIRDFY